jgi:hypothetical protein
MIYTAPCIIFWMRAYPLRGEVGGGWALEFSSFLGPVKWHRADRRVPFQYIIIIINTGNKRYIALICFVCSIQIQTDRQTQYNTNYAIGQFTILPDVCFIF